MLFLPLLLLHVFLSCLLSLLSHFLQNVPGISSAPGPSNRAPLHRLHNTSCLLQLCLQAKSFAKTNASATGECTCAIPTLFAGTAFPLLNSRNSTADAPAVREAQGQLRVWQAWLGGGRPIAFLGPLMHRCKCDIRIIRDYPNTEAHPVAALERTIVRAKEEANVVTLSMRTAGE